MLEDNPWNGAKMLSAWDAAGRRGRVYNGQTPGFCRRGGVLPVFPFLLPPQSEGQRWQPGKAAVASGSHRGIFQQRGGSEQ